MTEAELAADNGLYTGKTVGKNAQPRASDELEPLHRVRWSWHPQASSPSDAEGAKRVRSSAEVWPMLLSSRARVLHRRTMLVWSCVDDVYNV